MNNENQTAPEIPIPQVTNQIGVAENKTQPDFDAILKKVTENKIFNKKNLIIIVSVSVGIILTILILGLLFGKRGLITNQTNTTATPFVLSTPEPQVPNSLSSSPDKLNELKNKVEELDVKQGKLQPPILNFNIKF